MLELIRRNNRKNKVLRSIVKTRKRDVSQKRVLLVEDDPDAESLFKIVIKAVHRTAKIDTCQSAQMAIEMIAESERIGESYDLAMLDVLLKGNKTGLDVWDYIRLNEIDTDVVITSGLSYDAIKVAIGESRQPCFLEKPFQFREAQRLIANSLY